MNTSTLLIAAAIATLANACALADDPINAAPANAPSQSAQVQNAEPKTPSAQKSYVLTRLGVVNEGTLRDQGDSYVLEFDGGGSTVVSKLDAVYIGSSRESIFQYKLKQTPIEDVNELLKLADWASRRQLGGEAIKLLQERLNVLQDPGEIHALKQKLYELQQAEAFRADAAKFLAKRENEAKAKAERQAQTPKVDPNAARAKSDDAEIEEWAKAVPYLTIERFSKRAQPVLQKRCATDECHASKHVSHYVLRPKVKGPAARLALLYNLRATAEYVNFDDVEKSALLDHPTVVDGKGERVYPFGNDRNSLKDCELFVKWLESAPNEKILAEHVKKTKRVNNAPILREGAASRYDVADRSSFQQGRGDAFNAENPDARYGNTDGVDVNGAFADAFDDAGKAPFANSAPSDSANGASESRLGFGVSREALKYMPKPEDDPNSEEARLQRVGIKPQKRYRDEYDPAIFNDRFRQKAQ